MTDEKKIALNDLSPMPGARRPSRRLGRGHGSGSGKTSGRGHKGQKSRSGGSLPPWFEGGQMPLYRRVPKRGFKPLNKVENQVVSLGQLAELADDEITPEVMRARGLVGSAKYPVKVLATGELGRAITVRAHAFSGAARQKIEEAGGSVQVLDFRPGGESSD